MASKISTYLRIKMEGLAGLLPKMRAMNSALESAYDSTQTWNENIQTVAASFNGLAKHIAIVKVGFDGIGGAIKTIGEWSKNFLLKPFTIAIELAKKLFSVLRSIVMLPFNLLNAFKMNLDTGSAGEAAERNRSGFIRNTSGRNRKALEKAEQFNGVSLNLDSFSNALSNFDNAGDFATFGISTAEHLRLAKGDHIDAAFTLIPKLIQQIQRAGGFDDPTARSLYGNAAQSLGFSFDQLKALSEPGILNRLQKDYKEQKGVLGYSDKAFESAGRTIKKFESSVESLKDKIALQLIPIFQPLIEAFRNLFESIDFKGIGQSLQKALGPIVQKFSNWIKGDGKNAVSNIIAKLPEYFEKIVEILKRLAYVIVRGFGVVTFGESSKFFHGIADELKASIDEDKKAKAFEKIKEKISSGELSKERVLLGMEAYEDKDKLSAVKFHEKWDKQYGGMGTAQLVQLGKEMVSNSITKEMVQELKIVVDVSPNAKNAGIKTQTLSTKPIDNRSK